MTVCRGLWHGIVRLPISFLSTSFQWFEGFFLLKHVRHTDPKTDSVYLKFTMKHIIVQVQSFWRVHIVSSSFLIFVFGES